MTFKEQINKIKENWLFAVILIILLVFLLGGNMSGGMLDSISSNSYSDIAYKSMDSSYRGSTNGYYPQTVSDFAPEVEERKITTNSNMQLKIDNGKYYEVDTKVNSVAKLSNSIILSNNNNKHGTGKRTYTSGSYTIKVPVDMYDSVVIQLKDLGEITRFNENKNDITGSYTNTQIEIETEKTRLARYESMYNEATKIEDKINLNDRIFNQERRIKYLENSLKNNDQRVDYSTISLSISEKQPNYINVQMTKFSKLIENLVNSFNSLINLLFVILPWVIVLFVGRFVWLKVTKKKQIKI